jgi:hypothetical protein
MLKLMHCNYFLPFKHIHKLESHAGLFLFFQDAEHRHLPAPALTHL